MKKSLEEICRDLETGRREMNEFIFSKEKTIFNDKQRFWDWILTKHV